MSQAASGIGHAISTAFAEAGVVGLLCADINEAGAAAAAEHCKALASHVDCKVLSFPVNVTSPESVQSMVEFAKNEFKRIDYFVNSAGVGTVSPDIRGPPRHSSTFLPDLARIGERG
jgi:NAD(P)-dependent dehydrogenase (short-subunit alcohol dehydrogenase family)